MILRNVDNSTLEFCCVQPINQDQAATRRFARCLGLLLAAFLFLQGQSSQASQCGSYVMSAKDAHAAGHSQEHAPTPCESGQCNGPAELPATPPPAPSNPSFDRWILQTQADLSAAGDTQFLFALCSVHPQSGHRHPPERPPQGI